MASLLTTAPILGLIAMLMSSSQLLPIAISLVYADGALSAFVLSACFNFVCGYIAWLATRRFRQEIMAQDAILLVVLTWSGGALFATVPLLLTLPDLSFTDAYFETMSGLTTTGSTILSNLDRLPPSINIWRGFLQWLGGMGIIVLAIAVLPVLGIGGRQIYKAETPGPMKDTKLTPRLAETAKGLWLIYVGLSLACFAAYALAGMPWLDAFMHTLSTMPTGGFSNHDASFGHFDSPLLESIAIAFMLISAINYGSHFLALRARSLAPYRHDPEVGWFLLVAVGSCIGVASYLWLTGAYPEFLTALRHASFNLVSVATSTGFATQDFSLWPIFTPLWMMFLVSFLSCSGSTGGGIKMIRAVILYKQVYREFIRLLHPTASIPTKISGQPVENRVVFAVLAFLFIYIVCIVSLTLVLTASGLDVVTAFSAVIACLNNLGPGLNQVGPATTFEVLNDFQIWLLSAAMLIGRLELFTVLVILTPVFWRK
ncbi:MAG: TrkH family potassium uptake protein [Betaproteobacteria bacterium]|nr:TrkH family potassium uptake protein [Betaproteobacteria bacterium]